MSVQKSLGRLHLTASSELPWVCTLTILITVLSIRWLSTLGPDWVTLTLTGLNGEPLTLSELDCEAFIHNE